MSIHAPNPSLSFSSSSIFPKPRPFFFTPISSPTKTPKTLTPIRSALATLPVLSFSGDLVGSASLSLRSAPPATARAVVHRGLLTDQQNRRRGTASTLTRGEVRGGGRKPYPQKKTGHARRGSLRTPLRPGGGVIFGPKPRDWTIKINRKEKRLAISTAVASAAAAEDALVVEDFGGEFGSGPQTREFVAAMRRWGLDPAGTKATFLLTEVPDNVLLSCRNIGTVRMLTPRTLNLFDVLNSDKLVLSRSAVEYLNSAYGEDGFEDDGEEEEEVVLQEGDEGDEGDESS